MNDFMKKYVSSLKTGTVIEEKEPGVVYPLKDMMENLVKISDEAWGQYAFSRELLNNKFQEEKRKELILKANQCGIKYAEDLLVSYGNISPKHLAKQLNLKVKYPSTPVGGGHVLFAQFVEPNEISIFMDCIDKTKELLNDKGTAEALRGINIEKTLLSHEIFHYIEEVNKKDIFTKKEKVKLWAPKPFKNESRINCLGEIAGMAFAKRLLNLEFSPYVLDVFITYAYNEEAASALYEEIMRITGD